MNEININPTGVDFSSVRAEGVSDDAIARLANMPTYSGPSMPGGVELSDDAFDRMLAGAMNQGPMMVEPVREDPVKKRALIMKLQRYKEVFAHVLRDINLSGLDFKSQQELEGLLDEVRLVVSTKNCRNMFKQTFLAGISAIENLIAPRVNLRVQGLTQALAQSQEVQDLLNEISLEHQEYIYTKPEYRIMMTVTQTCLALHYSNKQMDNVKHVVREHLDKEVDEGEVEEYDDL